MKPSLINTSRNEEERIDSSKILRLHFVNILSTLNFYVFFTFTLHNLRLFILTRRINLHNNHLLSILFPYCTLYQPPLAKTRRAIKSKRIQPRIYKATVTMGTCWYLYCGEAEGWKRQDQWLDKTGKMGTQVRSISSLDQRKWWTLTDTIAQFSS